MSINTKAIINALDSKSKLYNNVFNIEEDNDLNIDTETLIQGNVTIGSNLNVNNKLIVDQGSTTIASALYISGDTSVYGTTVFTGCLFISGDTTFNNLASETTLFSNLNVSGQANFYESMTVTGVTNFFDNVNISGKTTIKDSATLLNTLFVAGDTTILGKLNIAGVTNVFTTNSELVIYDHILITSGSNIEAALFINKEGAASIFKAVDADSGRLFEIDGNGNVISTGQIMI
jgi:UDP-3-O-[3-hydroxymyristoyl] glucosamine N-acyltransferase